MKEVLYRGVDKHFDDGKSYIVKMVKTLAPDEIPNGSIGATRTPPNERGLRLVRFDTGWNAYCASRELEYA